MASKDGKQKTHGHVLPVTGGSVRCHCLPQAAALAGPKDFHSFTVLNSIFCLESLRGSRNMRSQVCLKQVFDCMVLQGEGMMCWSSIHSPQGYFKLATAIAMP